ncbi:MAG TPA: hypothetical protein QGH10_06005, partial [Armatimonadota bacterium]|nr:hypothetical protein [Armatimonadota bacterium]
MACSFLALAAMWIASPTWAGGGPENALIVVNANSEDSVVIADEYVRLRGSPACNVVRLES